MPLVIRKFQGLKALNLFMTGKIRGGVDLSKSIGGLFLHGRTLVFNTPAGTVTFASSPASAQVPITLKEALTQIEAAVATVKTEVVDNNLVLSTATPGPIDLDLTGTANSIFGFDTAADTTATPVNPSAGAVPKFVSLVAGDGGSYLLVTED